MMFSTFCLIFSGASFMLGRCLISTVWGIAADRIGRKTNCHVWHFLRVSNIFASTSIN